MRAQGMLGFQEQNCTWLWRTEDILIKRRESEHARIGGLATTPPSLAQCLRASGSELLSVSIRSVPSMMGISLDLAVRSVHRPSERFDQNLLKGFRNHHLGGRGNPSVCCVSSTWIQSPEPVLSPCIGEEGAGRPLGPVGYSLAYLVIPGQRETLSPTTKMDGAWRMIPEIDL